ncbi:MAG: peptidase [Deltaproteobacteria bacterium]|nr:MAG: peptidase [Deltaproteobacteria bacterium]
MRRFWQLLSVMAAMLAASGCGSMDGGAEGTVSELHQAIAGGYDDGEDTAVMAIVHLPSGSLCTGSLIAPNVVLTARHCVSPLENDAMVICAETTVGPLYPPEGFWVIVDQALTTSTTPQFLVQEVVGTGTSNDSLCGNDVAILILTESVPLATAMPLLPRITEALAVGETYSAVGYGAIDGLGSEPGMRRRRDDLVVHCIGAECDDSEVAVGEWVGNGGVCQGDSGGPALDGEGRVVGVTSRATMECDLSFYGYTVHWAPWLRDTVVRASGIGGYQAPSWTDGSTVDPEHSMPIGQSCGSDADCPSGRCLFDDGRSYCTRACSDVGPCPGGYQCEPRGDIDLCVQIAPPAPTDFNRADDDGSCAIALPGKPQPTGRWGWSLVAALALSQWMRRRSRLTG